MKDPTDTHLNNVARTTTNGSVQAQGETGGTADPGSCAGRDWLGNSVWQVPKIEISRIKSWAGITVVRFRRGAGEAIYRGDRHRLFFAPHQLPSRLLQVEQGATRQLPAAPPGYLAFCPAGVTTRSVFPEINSVHVYWDTGLYSAMLPELATAASRFEHLSGLQDPLLGHIVTTLAEEIEVGFADRILIETLGTGLCIRIAQRFVRLPLPTSSKGLSPERLRRVRDYIEAHLDDHLSLTALADIACLSPYHFSRSFKEAAGIGPRRYVIQRRLERAKTLLRKTDKPLALIAQEAGFANQAHLTSIFSREMGLTPGRFRAALV
jgi:AraC family transcriptional regulator